VTGTAASGGMVEIPVQTTVQSWGNTPPSAVQPAGETL
jgi:hypothetical protein